MQLASHRQQSLVRNISQLVAVGLVVAAIAVVSVLVSAGLPVGASAVSAGAGGQLYDMKMPNRAATFFQATTSLGNGRVQLQQAGNPAALAAVYTVSGGFDIYTINPQTGQGALAYHILTGEVESARAGAVAANGAVQVIPSAWLQSQGTTTVVPTATPRNARPRVTPVPTQAPGADLNPKVYVLPDGSCVVSTIFPDGSPVQFSFGC